MALHSRSSTKRERLGTWDDTVEINSHYLLLHFVFICRWTWGCAI